MQKIDLKLKQFVFSAALVALSGCTTLQRPPHLYSNEAPSPLSFTYKDGGSSVYYAFNSGDARQAETQQTHNIAVNQDVPKTARPFLH